MEVFMPLVAVIAGALTPVVVAIYAARREREEDALALQPLEHRAVRVVDYYRPGMRRTQDF